MGPVYKLAFPLMAAALVAACAAPVDRPATSVAREFSEEMPGWRMPELAITALLVEPAQVHPGDAVAVTVAVGNGARGELPVSTPAAELTLFVGDERAGTSPIAPIPAGATVQVPFTLTAGPPGRHVVRAELALRDGGFDGSRANNVRLAALRVGAPPARELELTALTLGQEPLTPHGSRALRLELRNTGASALEALDVELAADGEVVDARRLARLLPGGDALVPLTWTEPRRGGHVLSVRVSAPGLVDVVRGWHVALPEGSRALPDVEQHGRWAPLGPRILDNGWAGRVNTIAFAAKPTTAYVGGFGYDGGIPAAPGLWRTRDAGQSWVAVGDGLPSMLVKSVAVDPSDTRVVFAGGPEGILRSPDEGDTWTHFAPRGYVGDVGALVVRRTGSGKLLVYAGSDTGVWRYQDFGATNTKASDWYRIKQGDVRDLSVGPADVSTVYAVIRNDGFYRTDVGDSAREESVAGNHDWKLLSSALFGTAGKWALSLHVHPLYPNVVYAGVGKPRPGVSFGIYRSTSSGDDWKVLQEYLPGELDGGLYNPFLRVVPIASTGSYLQEVIYFGGVGLYQLVSYLPLGSAEVFLTGGTYQVTGYQVPLQAGVDLKTLAFDPLTPNPDDAAHHYFLLGDQGVFRCRVVPEPKVQKLTYEEGGKTRTRAYGASGDRCEGRNQDLAVSEMYQFDISPSGRLIAGTQDTGTIYYEGKPTWRMLHGGDGLYSLVNRADERILYSQEQRLHSTKRSPDGGKSWSRITHEKDASGNLVPKSLPDGTALPDAYFDAAFIAIDPATPDGLVARGDGRALYGSSDGGASWTAVDWDEAANGRVSRVVVHPNTLRRVVATETGRVFTRAASSTGAYELLFSHPHGAMARDVAFSPADADTLYVLFDAGAAYADERVWRIELDGLTPASSQATNVTRNLPVDLTARAVAGDPRDALVAYVGTDKGVLRHDAFAGSFPWRVYGEGLPRTTVTGLRIGPDRSLVAITKGRGAWRVLTGP